jgi:hypothetical protein
LRGAIADLRSRTSSGLTRSALANDLAEKRELVELFRLAPRSLPFFGARRLRRRRTV